MSTTFPAIAERDASGAVAALYDDIRSTLGAPVVNLVWRHLATLPGALEWCWSRVRPGYAGGTAFVAGARLREALKPSVDTALDRNALEAVGVGDAELGPIHRVLRAYNHTNALNLVALTALTTQSGDAAPPRERSPRHSAPAAGIDTAEPIVPVVDAAEASAPVRRLLGALDRLNGLDASGIPPTMYRHLANWPGYLALALTSLSPRPMREHLDERASRARSRARELAADVHLAKLGTRPPPPGSVEAVARFHDTVISGMVPIGLWLEAATPAPKD